MKYLIHILIYLYVATGVFISIKMFKHPIGKFLGAVWYGLFWIPLLLSDFIVNAMKRE